MIEGAWQLFALIDRYFASSMDAGIISSLGYCYLLIMLPIAIFAYALSTALFPYLSDAFANSDIDRSKHLLSRGINISLLFALPMTMIFWVFAEELVILLFRRGAFDLTSVASTSGLLRFFAFSLTGQFLLLIMSRAFYAAMKYRILIICMFAIVAAKAITTAFGVEAYGHIGLAISSSISYTFGALLFMGFAGRCLVRVDWKAVLTYFTKTFVATIAGYFVARMLYDWFINGIDSFGELMLRLPPVIGASLVTVIVVGHITNISDIRILPGLLRGKQDLDVDPN
jgi:putative peptidoglycan lipid II flippase